MIYIRNNEKFIIDNNIVSDFSFLQCQITKHIGLGCGDCYFIKHCNKGDCFISN